MRQFSAMRTLALFATLFAAAPAANTGGPSGLCYPSTSSPVICIYGQTDNNGNVVYTVHSSANGWASVGIGSSMSSATVYAGWKNSTGGITLSSRASTLHATPQALPPTSPETATQVPLVVAAPSWASIAFSFSRPVSPAAGKSVTANSAYIYAYSNSGPANPDSSTSDFPVHDNFGSTNSFNFLTTSGGGGGVVSAGQATSLVKLPAGWYYPSVVLAHGVIMVLAWLVAPTAGIFVARYLKQTLGHWWFRLHIAIMLGATTILGLVAFFLIVLFRNPPHFDEFHEILGLVITVGSVLQVILGYVIDAFFDPNRTAIPFIDKLHWWFGRVLILGALANIVLGFLQYHENGFGTPGSLIIATVIFALASIAVFIYGEFYYGQQLYHSITPSESRTQLPSRSQELVEEESSMI